MSIRLNNDTLYEAKKPGGNDRDALLELMAEWIGKHGGRKPVAASEFKNWPRMPAPNEQGVSSAYSTHFGGELSGPVRQAESFVDKSQYLGQYTARSVILEKVTKMAEEKGLDSITKPVLEAAGIRVDHDGDVEEDNGVYNSVDFLFGGIAGLKTAVKKEIDMKKMAEAARRRQQLVKQQQQKELEEKVKEVAKKPLGQGISISPEVLEAVSKNKEPELKVESVDNPEPDKLPDGEYVESADDEADEYYTYEENDESEPEESSSEVSESESEPEATIEESVVEKPSKKKEKAKPEKKSRSASKYRKHNYDDEDAYANYERICREEKIIPTQRDIEARRKKGENLPIWRKIQDRYGPWYNQAPLFGFSSYGSEARDKLADYLRSRADSGADAEDETIAEDGPFVEPEPKTEVEPEPEVIVNDRPASEDAKVETVEEVDDMQQVQNDVFDPNKANVFDGSYDGDRGDYGVPGIVPIVPGKEEKEKVTIDLREGLIQIVGPTRDIVIKL